MSTSLLSTKLTIPLARPEWVTRPRLLERLNRLSDYRLMLISAPAGYGKTTLLSEWAANDRLDLGVVWISLDEADNDIALFLAYLGAAVEPIVPQTSQQIAAMLQPPQPSSPTTILTDFINKLADAPTQLAFVLDDYHVIETQTIHDAVAFLLEHAPPPLHLIIATRADPPLPLARLRGRGQLDELRATDLCFTSEEASHFFERTSRRTLSQQEIDALTVRTEGWATGLQIAAMSLQKQPEVTQFIQAFTGSNRHILDYLLEEIFQRLPAERQTFLLQTSILDRLSSAVCEAVTNHADSQAILEELDKANLFIIPLDEDRRWYRYHRLFVDLLRQRLQLLHPDELTVLHQRASEWYDWHGFTAEAIEHALAANDSERAAQLIEKAAELTLMHGEVTTLLNWIQALPDDIVRTRSALCIYHAWALLLAARPMELIQARLKDAGVEADTDRVSVEAAVFRALLASVTGDVQHGVELSRQALERVPADRLFLRNIALSSLGMAHVLRGDIEAAVAAFNESARLGQQIGNVLFAVGALCNVAGLCLVQGQLHRAEAILHQALELATDANGRRMPAAGRALMSLGELAREWNDLATAERYLTEAVELSRQTGSIGTLAGYLHLARVKQAQGEPRAATELLQHAEQLALQTNATSLDDMLVKVSQARLSIMQGDLAAAAQWAQTVAARESSGHTPASYDLHEAELIVLARLAVAQQHTVQALDMLAPLLQIAEQQHRVRRLIDLLNLQALALHAHGDTAEAVTVLRRSLLLAEPEGFVRTFLDEGESMRLLISNFRLLAERQPPDSANRKLAQYAARLVATFPQSMPATEASHIKNQTSEIGNLVEPLSERELEVLRLVAVGLSNREIAERLTISLSTVKGHTANIYSKLAVNSRTQAVAAATALGLLGDIHR